jgi:hypothetical protein
MVSYGLVHSNVSEENAASIFKENDDRRVLLEIDTYVTIYTE